MVELQLIKQVHREAMEPSGPGANVADELAKLVGLRDSGVLSPEEFVVQKSRLLA
jgi:hypothetical protein